MAILTPQKVAESLDYDSPEQVPPKAFSYVPAIEEYLAAATGKRWGEEEPVDPLAEVVARVILVRWFEDPGQVGKVSDQSLITMIGMLKAKAGG